MEEDEGKHPVRVGREKVYAGSIVDFYQDRIKLPDGKVETWDFVAHRKGAAAVLAVTKEGKIVMVRQYRPALDRYTLEIPAGARDSVNEDTSVTAARELLEETGYRSEELKPLLSLKTTVAFCNEFVDVYLAEGLSRRADQHLDEGEAIEIRLCDLNDLVTMVLKGTIQDGKTCAAILAYQVLLDKRKEEHERILN